MKKNRIERKLFNITLTPLIIMGILMAVVGVFIVNKCISEDLKEQLKDINAMAIVTVDTLLPGDYTSYETDDGIVIAKGDVAINDYNDLLDKFKKKTGVEFTLFYGETRILTTLKDESGNRLVGTTISSSVIEQVESDGEPVFYTDTRLDDKSYSAYYCPIKNSDGTIVGMMASLYENKNGLVIVGRGATPLLLVTLVVLGVATIAVLAYSRKFRRSISFMSRALTKTANGEWANRIPAEVLLANDEMSQMAHTIVDMQASLKKLVERDVLTGLLNRRSGQMRLESLVTNGQESNEAFQVAIGDIDNFKRFNDEYGHDCGDIVLQEMSRLMNDAVKAYGWAIRWGGEEFLLVFKGTSFEEAYEHMSRLRQKICDHRVIYDDMELSVTMTFGLVDGQGYSTADEVVKAADMLLYEGKENGKNRVVIKDDSSD